MITLVGTSMLSPAGMSDITGWPPVAYVVHSGVRGTVGCARAGKPRPLGQHLALQRRLVGIQRSGREVHEVVGPAVERSEGLRRSARNRGVGIVVLVGVHRDVLGTWASLASAGQTLKASAMIVR